MTVNNRCNITGVTINEKNCSRCIHQLKDGEYCRELREMNRRQVRKWLNLPGEKWTPKAVQTERTLAMFMPEDYGE